MTQDLQQSDKNRAMEYATTIISHWIGKTNCGIEEVKSNLLSMYDAILHRMVRTNDKNNSYLGKDGDISSTYTDDYIVCLEDGKKLKMLKRHLRSKYGMTVEEYKNKWSLPHDYPVVTRNYSKERSSIARKIKTQRNKK